MKRLLQVMMFVGCMLMLSTSAWSASNIDHVSQAPNGKGDVLIFPLYMVLDGSFQSKIQVVNTKTDASAVAKVIVRSPVNSFELRDFLIFLSPTDMWEGTLKMNDGKVTIYSEDDSTLTSSAPTFASASDPFEYDLEEKVCDTNVYGYVEVFLGHVFSNNIETEDGTVNLTNAPVNKTDIYDAYVGTGSIDNPNPAGLVPYEIQDADYRNILAGNVQIGTTTAAWTSALNAVALKDYKRTNDLTVADNTGFNEPGNNSITEVEAALSKNSIGMPYYNDADNGKFSLHFFHFPTKLVTDVDEQCEPEGWDGTYQGFDKVDVSYHGYDMQENTVVTKKPIVSPYPEEEQTTFDEELSLFVPTAFTKGWYRYDFGTALTDNYTADETPVSYQGAPVIPLCMHFGSEGLSMQYGFSSDGNVLVDGTEVGGYQYVQGYAVTQ